jgi:glutathione reductase (NADPH)
MPNYDYDLITIGAGSGGVRGSRMAAKYGARVAVCEESRVGGTCVIRGCVPKKLLVYGSHFADDFEDAAGYGWTVSTPSPGWAALIARKNAEIDRLNGIYINLLANSDVALLDGKGRLIDAHTVEVAGRTVTAANILIATGSWPMTPPVAGIEHAISSNEALDLMQLPRRMVIIGGGYIAVEFAGIFKGFGVEVTVIEILDNILAGFDDDLRATLAAEMDKRGIAVRTSTVIESIEKTATGYRLAITGEDAVETDLVMCATGRAPNTRGIGLEEAGVELDRRGAVVVDAYSRTSVANIFAVGDATNRMNLTPVAIAEGSAVAETLFNDNPTTVDHTGIPTAVFSQPPMATVGLTEAAARQAHGNVDVYTSEFRPMKYTLSGRDERTFMKLVVDPATDRVLGCHMAGADAPEIIQGLAIALKCGATKAQFDATVGIHPSAAEEFVTMREKRPA